nr:hypothetical protein [Jiangella sp. DSM 45060]
MSRTRSGWPGISTQRLGLLAAVMPLLRAAPNSSRMPLGVVEDVHAHAGGAVAGPASGGGVLVLEVVDLDGLDADRHGQPDRPAGRAQLDDGAAGGQRGDQQAGAVRGDVDDALVVAEVEVDQLDGGGEALRVAAGDLDPHRVLRSRVADREPARGQLQRVQFAEDVDAAHALGCACGRMHDDAAAPVRRHLEHRAVDGAAAAAPADAVRVQFDRGEVVVDGLRGERAVQAGERAGVVLAGRDDQLLRRAAARRHEQADAVRVRPLGAVGGAVADGRGVLAERARHHRRRAAAVEVPGLFRAQAHHEPGQLAHRHAVDRRLPPVVRHEDHRAAVVLEADDGARVDGVVELGVRAGDAVADQLAVGADDEAHLPGDLVAELVAERHAVARLQGADRGRAGLPSDQHEGAVGDGAFACPAGVDGDHPLVLDQHRRDVGGAADADGAAVAAPGGRVGDDGVRGGAGHRVRRVQRGHRVRAAPERRRRVERHVDRAADAVPADADVRPRPVVRRLQQLAVADLRAQRRAGVVDVEEVAVDPGDRPGLVHHDARRLAVGDVLAGQQVAGDGRVGEVGGEDVLVVPAGRGDGGQLAQRDAGPDLLGPVHQLDRVVRQRRLVLCCGGHAGEPADHDGGHRQSGQRRHPSTSYVGARHWHRVLG